MNIKKVLIAMMLSASALNAFAGFPCTGANGAAGTSLTQGGFCYVPLAPDEPVCLDDFVCVEPTSGGGSITFTDVAAGTNVFLNASTEGRVRHSQQGILGTFSNVANLFSSFARFSRLDNLQYVRLTEETNRVLKSRGTLESKVAQFERYMKAVLNLRSAQ